MKKMILILAMAMGVLSASSQSANVDLARSSGGAMTVEEWEASRGITHDELSGTTIGLIVGGVIILSVGIVAFSVGGRARTKDDEEDEPQPFIRLEDFELDHDPTPSHEGGVFKMIVIIAIIVSIIGGIMRVIDDHDPTPQEEAEWWEHMDRH